MYTFCKEIPPSMKDGGTLLLIQKVFKNWFCSLFFDFLTSMPRYACSRPCFWVYPMSCEAPCRFKRQPALLNTRINSECFM